MNPPTRCDRVRTVPGYFADVDPADIGLLWIDDAQQATAVLEAAPPVVCRVSAEPVLEDTHTRFVRLDEAQMMLAVRI